MKVNLLKKVYDYLKDNPTPISLKDLCDKIKREDKTIYLEDNVVSDLYVELVLDSRFFLNDKSEWTLKEYAKMDEVKKQHANFKEFNPTVEFKTEFLDILDDDEDDSYLEDENYDADSLLENPKFTDRSEQDRKWKEEEGLSQELNLSNINSEFEENN